MTVIAGVCQVGLSFAFVYSQGPMMSSLTVAGASDSGAIAAVWAATLPGGAVVNLVYPLLLVLKRHNWKCFLDLNDFLLCMVRSALFVILILCMGNGMRCLGGLGASLGFGIYQGIQVVSSQSVGIISGEWHGVSRQPKISMIAAVVLILICVGGMAVVKAG